MATKKRAIGAIIKLDGESTFRASIQNCKSSLGTMKTELQGLQSTYDGNANSIEALSAIQNKYSEMQEAAARGIEKTAAAYEASAKKTEDVRASMQQMLQAYQDAERELQRMRESGTASAEAIEEQQRATDAAYATYQQYAASVERCETRNNYFKKTLSELTTEEREAGESADRYAAYLREAEQSADGCATSIDRFGDVLEDSTHHAENAGQAMAVFAGSLAADLATDGLRRVCDLIKEGASASIELGSDLESSLSHVQALSGATEIEIKTLKDTALDLGRESKRFTAIDVSDAFGYMALAGWQVNQQLAAIPGVIDLATAAEMDLANASDMVTDYLTAFGLGAEKASYMADMLSYAQAHSNTTATQLGEAYGNCAANMNAAGQSIETTTALLEGMANEGRKGSEAGTNLAAIMRDATSKMSDGAIQIGETSVAVMDANGNFRDLIDIMGDVETATDGMGTAERAAALSMTFTDESLKGVNLVLNEGTDKIRGYKAELENCDGASKQMADTMSNNLKGAMNGTSSAAQGLGEAVYDYFSGPLTDAFNGLTDIINTVTDSIKVQKTALEEYIDQVGETNTAISQKLNDTRDASLDSFRNVTQIQEYVDVITEARKQSNLSEFDMWNLENAVQSLSATFPELNQYIGNTDGLLGMTEADFSKLSQTFVHGWSSINRASDVTRRNSYLNILTEAQDVKAQAQAAVDDVNAQLDELKQKRASWKTDGDTTSYRKSFDTERDLKKIRKSAESELTAANQNFETAYTNMAKCDKLLADAVKYGDVYIDETGQMVMKTDETAEAAINASNAMNSMGDAADSTGESVSSMGNAAEGAFNEMSDAAEDGAGTVADAMAEAVNAYKTALSDMANQNPADAVRNQMAGVAEEITQFKEMITGSFSNFSLFGDTDDLMDIYTSSSKTVMKENAERQLNLMNRYADELQNLKSRGVSDEFLSYLTSQGTQGLEYIHNMAAWSSDEELKIFQEQFDQYESFTTGMNDKVKSIMEDYTESVMSGIEGGKAAWYQYGFETPQGMLDGIAEAQKQMDMGLLTGSFTDAMNVYLQARRNNEAVYNKNTGSMGGDLNTARKNEKTETTIILDVSLDGDPIVSRVNAKNKEDLRIHGGSRGKF